MVQVLRSLLVTVIVIMNTADASESSSPEARLRQAAAAGDAQAVRDLLRRGANIEARDDRGRSPLLLATHAAAIEAARVLIEAGADVNAMDDISDSPYLYAGAEGPLEILRMTLEHGADLASVNRYGGTALIPAAHHGHVDIVRELLGTGIDIDHVNYLGWTALLEAVILGDGGRRQQDVVRILLTRGADPTIADRDGGTALQHARNRGFTELADLLTD